MMPRSARRLAAGRLDRPLEAAALPLRRHDLLPAIPATRSPRRCSPTACTLVGRSFKYHRPRGILTAGSEEPNALVELRDGRAARAEHARHDAELYDGLVAASQNRWPSLRFDLMAINQLLAPIFVAGFYYKTFMWPATFWEKRLRAADPPRRRARPRAPALPIPTTTRRPGRIATCWSSAAAPPGWRRRSPRREPARASSLCERGFRASAAGCSPTAARSTAQPAAEWVADVAAELAALPDVRIMTRTTVFGVYDGGTYGALERVNDHVAGAAAAPAAPAALADRRQALRGRRRRDRAAARLSAATTGPA